MSVNLISRGGCAGAKGSDLNLSGVNLSFALLYLLPGTAFEIQINSHSTLLVGA